MPEVRNAITKAIADALIAAHTAIATAHQDAPALIATHTAIPGAHHTKYTDAEVQTIITAQLVDGQSIDVVIDTLITTHTAIATAHQDAPGLIATHTGLPNAHHSRIHAITDILDHSAGNWKTLYSNGASQIAELSLGVDGRYLMSNGPAVAPTWEEVPPGYTDGEADARIVVQNTHPAGTIDIAIDALIAAHTAIATAHQDAPGLIATHAALPAVHQDAPALIATHTGLPNAHHNRSHAITGTSDHTANNWKTLYSNGASQIIELSLGVDGRYLMSNGPAVAPTWEEVPPGYTDGEAVAAVEAAGLALASAKLITSADEDLTFTFGRASLGSPTTDELTLAHRDVLAALTYALKQTAAGKTAINSASGQTLDIRINNTNVISVNAAQIDFSQDLDMNNKDVINANKVYKAVYN